MQYLIDEFLLLELTFGEDSLPKYFRADEQLAPLPYVPKQ